MIVADTNVILYLITKRPPAFYKLAKQVYLSDSIWCAPLLWRSEFMNVLATYVRHKHITRADAVEAMELALEVIGDNEYETDFKAVLKLTADTRASAYDCEFIALAQRLGVKLITNDGPLLKAFPHDTISLQEFSA